MQGTQGPNSKEHRARESYSSTCSPPPTQVLVIHPDYIHVLHGKIKFFVYFFPPREVNKRGEALVNLKTSSHLAMGSFPLSSCAGRVRKTQVPGCFLLGPAHNVRGSPLLSPNNA